MNSASRRRMGWGLAVVFAVALLMGPGPGMQVANRAEPIWGLPALYAWGLLWYAVEVVVVVLAYAFVWRREGLASDTAAGGPPSNDGERGSPRGT